MPAWNLHQPERHFYEKMPERFVRENFTKSRGRHRQHERRLRREIIVLENQPAVLREHPDGVRAETGKHAVAEVLREPGAIVLRCGLHELVEAGRVFRERLQRQAVGLEEVVEGTVALGEARLRDPAEIKFFVEANRRQPGQKNRHDADEQERDFCLDFHAARRNGLPGPGSRRPASDAPVSSLFVQVLLSDRDNLQPIALQLDRQKFRVFPRATRGPLRTSKEIGKSTTVSPSFPPAANFTGATSR